ncbi:MAG: hypothetical protein ABIJ34_09310 [archaeon]
MIKQHKIGGRTIEYFVELVHHPSAPLADQGLNVLSLNARSDDDISPDDLALALLDYLRVTVDARINYSRSDYTKGSGAPEARGFYFVGDNPRESNILYQVKSYLNILVRLVSKRTICNTIDVQSFSEDNLIKLLAYANS